MVPFLSLFSVISTRTHTHTHTRTHTHTHIHIPSLSFFTSFMKVSFSLPLSHSLPLSLSHCPPIPPSVRTVSGVNRRSGAARCSHEVRRCALHLWEQQPQGVQRPGRRRQQQRPLHRGREGRRPFRKRRGRGRERGVHCGAHRRGAKGEKGERRRGEREREREERRKEKQTPSPPLFQWSIAVPFSPKFTTKFTTGEGLSTPAYTLRSASPRTAEGLIYSRRARTGARPGLGLQRVKRCAGRRHRGEYQGTLRRECVRDSDT